VTHATFDAAMSGPFLLMAYWRGYDPYLDYPFEPPHRWRATAMGRGFVEYHLCESGRDEWVLWSAFIDYRFADGSRLHITQQPAWCPACRRFVIAEWLPPVEELEEEIDRYRSADPDTLRKWAIISSSPPEPARMSTSLVWA
jgi:hypothetical protein